MIASKFGRPIGSSSALLLGILSAIQVLHACDAAPSAAPECADVARWGTFSSPPGLKPDPHDPLIDVLQEDFTFTDGKGREWVARKGLRWDGTSIPQWLWSPFGTPKSGCDRLASMIHDEFYKRRGDHPGTTRKAVDEVFYQACRAKSVGRARAGIMYYALRWFGEGWDDAGVERTSMSEGDAVELLKRLELELERGTTSAMPALAARPPQDDADDLVALDRLPAPDELVRMLPTDR